MIVKLARLIVAGVLAISFLLAMSVEIWVRIRDPYDGIASVMKYHPTRLTQLFPYVGRYGGQDVHINALGFRDYARVPPLALEKRQPGTRIMAFGDSYTFGGEIPVEATFPFLTERALTASRPEQRWEVINAGVSGYDTFQALSFIRESVDSYRPDLVVLAYTLNDIGPTPFVRDGGWRALVRPVSDWLSEHSYAWHYLPDLWAAHLWTVAQRDPSTAEPPAPPVPAPLPSGA